MTRENESAPARGDERGTGTNPKETGEAAPIVARSTDIAAARARLVSLFGAPPPTALSVRTRKPPPWPSVPRQRKHGMRGRSPRTGLPMYLDEHRR